MGRYDDILEAPETQRPAARAAPERASGTATALAPAPAPDVASGGAIGPQTGLYGDILDAGGVSPPARAKYSEITDFGTFGPAGGPLQPTAVDKAILRFGEGLVTKIPQMAAFLTTSAAKKGGQAVIDLNRKRAEEELAQAQEGARAIGAAPPVGEPGPLRELTADERMYSRRMKALNVAQGLVDSIDTERLSGAWKSVFGSDFQQEAETGKIRGTLRDHWKYGLANTSVDQQAADVANRVLSGGLSYEAARAEIKDLLHEKAGLEQSGQELLPPADHWYSRWVQGAVQSLGPMAESTAVGYLPGANLVYWQQQGTGDILLSYLKERDVDQVSDEELRKLLVTAESAGLLYGATELAQGWIPGLRQSGLDPASALARKFTRGLLLKHPVVGKITRTALRQGLQIGLEDAEEGVQKVITESAQQIADPDQRVTVLRNVWTGLKEMWDALGPVTLISLAGGGAASVREMAQPRQEIVAGAAAEEAGRARIGPIPAGARAPGVFADTRETIRVSPLAPVAGESPEGRAVVQDLAERTVLSRAAEEGRVRDSELDIAATALKRRFPTVWELYLTEAAGDEKKAAGMMIEDRRAEAAERREERKAPQRVSALRYMEEGRRAEEAAAAPGRKAEAVVAPSPMPETRQVAAPQVEIPPAEKPAAPPALPPAGQPVHENASTQMDLDEADADEIRRAASFIPDSELMGDGRETEPHITLKYGVRDDAADLLADALRSEGPIEATLGRLKTFPPSENSDGAAVVYAEVVSPQLVALRKRVADLAGERADDFEYKPHITLAYVKPEVAEKYADGGGLEGLRITLTRVAVSRKNGEKVIIPLKPRQAEGGVAGSAAAAGGGESLTVPATREAAYAAVTTMIDGLRADATAAEVSRGFFPWTSLFSRAGVSLDSTAAVTDVLNRLADNGYIGKDDFSGPIGMISAIMHPGVTAPPEVTKPAAPAGRESLTKYTSGVQGRLGQYRYQSPGGRVVEISAVIADGPGGARRTKTREEMLAEGRRETRQTPPTPPPIVPAAAEVSEVRKILAADGTPASRSLALRRYASRNNLSLKKVQEEAEAELVNMANDVARARAGDPESKFKSILALYEAQPTLTARTSTSVEQQAYSTPLPLGYVLSRILDLPNAGAVYEPTAGNGALLVGSNPATVRANELNADRRQALEAQGYTVTGEDATKYVPQDPADAIPMNPPFGSLGRTENYEGFAIKKIEHLIALKALEALTPDGGSVIITGAKRESGPLGQGADRTFLNYLYNHFNVVDHFELEGQLYARQGAGWPVRVVVISGRKTKPETIEDLAPQTVDRLSDWGYIYKRGEEARNEVERQRQRVVPERGGSQPVVPSPARPETPGEPAGLPGVPAADVGAAGGRGRRGRPGGGEPRPVGSPGPRVSDDAAGGTPARPEGAARPAEPAGAGRVGPRGVEGEGRGAPPAPVERPESGRGRGGPGVPGRAEPRAVSGTRPLLGQARTELQNEYVPASASESLGTLVPGNIAQPVADFLTKLRSEVGDVDAWVAEQLGYPDVAALHAALAAEQVDGVAVAIYQIEHGGALVLGDETGIGKGRQAAAIMRYALRTGRTPIFFTKDPKLFTDIHRDLSDIGSTFKPFILGDSTKAAIVDENNKVLFRPPGSASERRAVENAIVENGLEAEGYDTILVTYSQVNRDNDQQRFLERVAREHPAVVILDESHEASGAESMQSVFMRGGTLQVGKGAKRKQIEKKGLLNRGGVEGTLYSSATWAKRAENMLVYYKTLLGKAAGDMQHLVSAMVHGGVAMQQVVSEALAQVGQYIRRERDFSGVRFEQKPVEAQQAEGLVETTDAITAVYRQIRDFSAAVREAIHRGALGRVRATAQTQTAIDYTEFASIAHNHLSQLLLGLKVPSVVHEAVEAFRRGEKPVVALMNTMEAVLNDFVEDAQIKAGDEVRLSFRDLLRRALDRTLRASEKDAQGNSETFTFTAADVGLQAQYNEILETIEQVVVDVPVSPIDAIRKGLQDAGIRTGEMTGRSSGIRYTKDLETGVYERRAKANKNRLVNDFNNGDLDALILNASGSTGLSLHASPLFRERPVKTRHMIIAQPHLDINVVIQTLGRIKRTGMIPNGARYTMPVLPLEAEKRPAIMLERKLKSLNANTTAGAEGAVSLQVVDFFNRYGDEVVARYLAEERPDLALAVDLHPTVDDKGMVHSETDDIARVFTGRMALFPNGEQVEIYADIGRLYEDYVAYLKQTDQYDLETSTYEDWDGELLSDEVLQAGPDESNIFTASTRLQQWRVKDTRHIATSEEMAREAGRKMKSPEAVAERLDELEKEVTSRLQQVIDGARDESRRDEARAYLQQFRELTLPALRTYAERNAGHFVEVQDTETGEGGTGMIVGLDIPQPTRTGPVKARPGSMILHVLVNRPGGRLRLPLSQITGGRYVLNRSWEEAEEIDANKGKERYDRWVIQGNPIRAMVATKNKGRLVRFRARDGRLVTGLLMPMSWQKTELAADPRLELVNGRAAVLWLTEEEGGIESGVCRLGVDYRHDWRLTVPAAKARGANVYLDKKLRDLVGDFEKSGNKMAVIVDREALERVATRVSELVRALWKPAGAGEKMIARVLAINQRATGGRGERFQASMRDLGAAGVTPEQDARYLELAKDPEGNKAELQKMVDEAAKLSMSEPLRRLHDSPVRSRGILKVNDATADRYLRDLLDLAKERGNKRAEEYVENAQAAYLRGEWADAVVASEGALGYLHWDERLSTSSALGEMDAVENRPESIIEPPITRDDSGNVIPLSARFNPQTPDIRFSARELAERKGVRYESPREGPPAEAPGETPAGPPRGRRRVGGLPEDEAGWQGRLDAAVAGLGRETPWREILSQARVDAAFGRSEAGQVIAALARMSGLEFVPIAATLPIEGGMVGKTIFVAPSTQQDPVNIARHELFHRIKKRSATAGNLVGLVARGSAPFNWYRARLVDIYTAAYMSQSIPKPKARPLAEAAVTEDLVAEELAADLYGGIQRKYGVDVEDAFTDREAALELARDIEMAVTAERGGPAAQEGFLPSAGEEEPAFSLEDLPEPSREVAEILEVLRREIEASPRRVEITQTVEAARSKEKLRVASKKAKQATRKTAQATVERIEGKELTGTVPKAITSPVRRAYRLGLRVGRERGRIESIDAALEHAFRRRRPRTAMGRAAETEWIENAAMHRLAGQDRLKYAKTDEERESIAKDTLHRMFGEQDYMDVRRATRGPALQTLDLLEKYLNRRLGEYYAERLAAVLGQRNADPREMLPQWRDAMVQALKRGPATLVKGLREALDYRAKLRIERSKQPTSSTLRTRYDEQDEKVDNLRLQLHRRLQDTTWEELRDLFQTIAGIVAENRSAQIVRLATREMRLDDLAAQATEEVRSAQGESLGPGGRAQTLPRLGKGRLRLLKADGHIRALALGGGKPNGINVEVLDRELAAGNTASLTLIRNIETEFQAYLKELGVNRGTIIDWSTKARKYKVGGKDVELTVAQQMALAALFEDAEARNEVIWSGITPGQQWGQNKSWRAQEYEDTTYELQQIVDDLSMEQRGVVDKVVSLLTGMGRGGNAVTIELFGYEMFTSRRYFPVRRDISGKPRVTLIDMADPGKFRQTSLERLGLTQRRVPNRWPILLGNIFDVFNDHVSEMAAFSHLTLPIHNALALFNHADYAGAVRTRFGTDVIVREKDMMSRLAGLTGHSDNWKWLQRVSEGIGRRASIAVLAFRISTWIYNRVGGSLLAVSELFRLSPKMALQYVARIDAPLRAFWISAENRRIRDLLLANGYFWDRWSDNATRVQANLPTEVDSKLYKSRFQMYWRLIQDKSLRPMAQAEMKNAVTVVKVALANGYSEADALQLAEDTTRRTQNPSTALEESSLYEDVKKGGWTVIVPFLGQPAVAANLLERDLLLFRGAEGARAKTRAARNYFVTLLALALNVAMVTTVRQFFRAARRGFEPPEDEEREKVRQALNIINETADLIFPGAGRVMDSVVAVWRSGAARDNSFVGRLLEGGVGGMKRIASALEEGEETGEVDEAKLTRGMSQAGEAASMLLGVPAGGLFHLGGVLGGMAQAEEGEDDYVPIPGPYTY